MVSFGPVVATAAASMASGTSALFGRARDGVRRLTMTSLLRRFRTRYCRAAPPATLLPQYLLDGGKRARIVLLTEPECGFLAHPPIAVRLHQLDEHRNGAVVGQLRDGEDRFVAHAFVRIIIDGSAHGRGSFVSCL